ncbi:hypothetical protein ACUXD9_000507 [Escherichia coli]|uniref:hypothetical protein n=1 Tax=Escherichia coli TaxID=562 RepID=UPI0017E8B5FE|nr:hypothetical protein [Escherichia coli]HAX8335893.1 hypothetical protein [Escherichia coli]
MGLISGNTHWVLFLPCENQPEDRHVQDLVHGVFCLESSGIQPSNISIYIDGQNRANFNKLISIATQHNYTIKPTSEFFTDCDTNSYENLVMFVTGHGSMNGLDSAPIITPYRLLDRLKNTPVLKQAIVYLGQCFAGVFNYLPAGQRKRGEDADPDVILIGATSLHESLSNPTTENINGIDFPWVANQFLYHVFKWISSPNDIDGDGKHTVIDSYKYAGISSNMTNRRVKIGSFVASVDLHEQWNTAKKDHEANLADPQKLLLFRALDQQYYEKLNINYIHQECWILNSVPAQSVEF